jgi:DNA anti-recombination protein RmuC
MRSEFEREVEAARWEFKQEVETVRRELREKLEAVRRRTLDKMRHVARMKKAESARLVAGVGAAPLETKRAALIEAR